MYRVGDEVVEGHGKCSDGGGLKVGATSGPWTPLGGLPRPRWPPRTVRQPRGGPKVTKGRAVLDLAAISHASVLSCAPAPFLARKKRKRYHPASPLIREIAAKPAHHSYWTRGPSQVLLVPRLHQRHRGQDVLHLRALLKGFAYLQYGPTEIWEDKACGILMSENPTNRERSRHVDVRVHFLRDMVRDGSVKLVKCADTQNVADALTKSLPRPAFHKHREFLKGTAQSFSAFFASIYEPAVPAYVTKRGSLSFSKGPPKCIGG